MIESISGNLFILGAGVVFLLLIFFILGYVAFVKNNGFTSLEKAGCVAMMMLVLYHVLK